MPGSGTVSTRTSCLPCQVNARIGTPLVRRRLAHTRARPAVHPRRGDLAGFHELLEASQIAARLNLGLALQEFRDQLADAARGRIVGNCRGYPRAAPAGRIAKVDPATVRDVGAGVGLPADQLVRNILDDHRIPFDRLTRRRAHDPMRAPLVYFGDALDVLHDPRQIAERSEEHTSELQSQSNLV